MEWRKGKKRRDEIEDDVLTLEESIVCGWYNS